MQSSTMSSSSRLRGYVPKGSPRTSLTTKTRSRKPLQVVDTNLSSYDRTDPFAAFNALRKLLSGLATRIGGCQYKFSPEEYKLSLHFLTIVEPFVGLTPSPRTLTRQPTEILDYVAFFIESKRDLLSLGQTCKRMHDIVFPRHFEYRVIACKFSQLSVWNHLVVHRSLARNVRMLEIIDERHTGALIIPSAITTSDTDLESSDDELTMRDKLAHYFLTALSRMSGLRTFVWSCNHSLISIDDVWPTLLKCRFLAAVEISDNVLFSPFELEEASSDSDADSDEQQTPQTAKKANKRVESLTGLKTVALRSNKHPFGASKAPQLARAKATLDHCPNIETLTISYTPRTGTAHSPLPAGDELFLCARWAHLRALTLTNVACATPTAVAAACAFLAAHEGLEVLNLDIGRVFAGALQLPPGALPRLKELKAPKEIACAVMACPVVHPMGGNNIAVRPLETLKGPSLTGGGCATTFLSHLARHSIKRLELGGFTEFEDIRRLTAAAPRLNWLDVGKRRGSGIVAGAHTNSIAGGSVRGNSGGVFNFSEWATLLSCLPELTAFHGVRFFYETAENALTNSGGMMQAQTQMLTLSERSRIKKNDEVAAVLSWKCPKLRRVDHWDENSSKIIVLLRDGDKARWEVRRCKI